MLVTKVVMLAFILKEDSFAARMLADRLVKPVLLLFSKLSR